MRPSLDTAFHKISVIAHHAQNQDLVQDRGVMQTDCALINVSHEFLAKFRVESLILGSLRLIKVERNNARGFGGERKKRLSVRLGI